MMPDKMNRAMSRDELKVDTSLDLLRKQLNNARRFIEVGEANLEHPEAKELLAQVQQLASSKAWAIVCW